MKNRLIVVTAGILMFSASVYAGQTRSAVDFDSFRIKAVMNQAQSQVIDMTALQILPKEFNSKGGTGSREDSLFGAIKWSAHPDYGEKTGLEWVKKALADGARKGGLEF